MKTILIAIGLMALSFTLFSALDLHLESQIEMVNGTVTGKCRYYEPGDLVTNSSNPLPHIEVDGKEYICREVELDGIGDFGSSIYDDYQIGDHIEMKLMPYHPYSIWYDTPTLIIFIWMPYIFGLLWIVVRIRFGDQE